MPDGPHYDDDFYAWTQHQAAVLRAMSATDDRFDREHLAEEIEALGRGERDMVRSQIRRIIEHFLKTRPFAGRAATVRLDGLDRRSARRSGRQTLCNVAPGRRGDAAEAL
jgi:Domain of unknown function DUF29